MKLTTKGRYAVTAMLDLAIHAKKGPVSLSDISVRQGISLSYLEQLFSKLRRSDLVNSIRGPGGGYQLSQLDADISVAAIVDAVSESMDATRCNKQGNCQEGEQCLSHHLWQDLSEQIHTFLSGISLAELIQRNEILSTAQRQKDKVTLRIPADSTLEEEVLDLEDELLQSNGNSVSEEPEAKIALAR